MYLLMDCLGRMQGRLSALRDVNDALRRWADDRLSLGNDVPPEIARQDAHLALALLSLTPRDGFFAPVLRPFLGIRRRFVAWRFRRRNAPPLESR